MFLKEHLAGVYNWADQTQGSVYTGTPTRRAFDRYNGDQMLFIINLYASITQRVSISEGRRMEALLVNHLPMENKSEISVFNWLREAFNTTIEDEVSLKK